MTEILESSAYALFFMAESLVILGLGFWVLDLITPGHKLGERLFGDVGDAVLPSYSAGLVTSAWMLMQGGIIFTSIWTNAHGTDFWAALGWTAVFSVLGLILQTVAFFALDLLTPGKLSDEVCAPGPISPLAMVAAANVVAIGLIVIASIS